MSKVASSKNFSIVCRCVNCSWSIVSRNRKVNIEHLEEPMLILLRAWVVPTQVDNEDFICVECFILLRERLSKSTEDHSPALGHRDVCYGCGISILRRKKYRISLESPLREIILTWIPSHHIKNLKDVCAACYTAASRHVKKEQMLEKQKEEEATSEEDNIEPLEADNIDVDYQPHDQHSPVVMELKIISKKYKRIAATSKQCLFPICRSKDRLCIPKIIKNHLLLKYKIYAPSSARVCKRHLYSNQWKRLKPSLTDFTGAQVDDIFNKLEKIVTLKKKKGRNSNRIVKRL